jgi:hypothetical protein
VQHLYGEIELVERHPADARPEPLCSAQAERAAPAAALVEPPAPGARDRQPDADRHRGCERGGQGRDNEAVSSLPPAPWWTVRRAANRKPATYRCPFCGHLLPALSEHMLIAPEGDTRRRRHAHSECVLAARRRGQLPLREEWLRSQPRRASMWRRLLRRA